MYTTTSVSRLAMSQLSYREGHSNGHWNNHQKYSTQLSGMAWSDGQPWCDVFANWCFWQAGVAVPTGALSASCAASMAAYKKAGRWTEYPVIGAQVFYGFGTTTANHTGIVLSYTDGVIHTIEGNTNDSGSREGDGVYQKSRVRRSATVLGYGIPYYHEKAVSPDPKWNGKDMRK